jgi:cation transport protein ChaC
MAPLRTKPAKGLDLTAELVARVERFEPDPGPEPGTTEHTEAEFDAMVEALLFEYKPQELWIFAYGSLIWNPEFDFLESRSATAFGWHRSFCLKLTRWRGTRELPALMLALDRGGSCNGLAYRLPAQDHFKQLGQLMVREIDANASPVPPTGLKERGWKNAPCPLAPQAPANRPTVETKPSRLVAMKTCAVVIGVSLFKRRMADRDEDSETTI